MKRLIFVLVVLGLCAGAASAGNYSVGYTFTDKWGSYTYSADGYWYDSYGHPYTLKEWRVWDPYYCRYVTKYEYTRIVVQQPVVINNVKAKDFWERLADNLANKEETDKRFAALQTFYGGYAQGASYGQQHGFNQRIDLYGGQFSIQQGPQYAQIDLNTALLQQALNSSEALKIGPAVNKMFADTIDKMAAAASVEAQAREYRQFMVQMQSIGKPAATIQQKVNGLESQVSPAIPNGAQAAGLDVRMENIQTKAVIAKKRLKTEVQADKHMPPGKSLSQAEINVFVFGTPKQVAELDAKYTCSSCHQQKNIPYSPQ